MDENNGVTDNGGEEAVVPTELPVVEEETTEEAAPAGEAETA